MHVDFEVLARGPFPSGRVTARRVERSQDCSAEWRASIEHCWQEGLREARSRGGELFDGGVLRLVDHRVDQGPRRLALDVDLGGYKEFFGTHLRQGHRWGAVDARWFSNAVGTSSLVLTDDGQVVLGRRSEAVAHHGGRLHCFGGILEPGDLDAEGAVDVEGSIRRELREELGLDDAEIPELECLGLVRDHEIHQPELLFQARVTRTFPQLRSVWRGAESRAEHQDLVALPASPAALCEAMDEDLGLVPVARAALLLRIEEAASPGPAARTLGATMSDETLPATDKLFRADSWRLEFDARVLVDRAGPAGREVCLDRTAFYPTGGGQAHDTGALSGRRVLDVRSEGQAVVHVLEGEPPLAAGASVHGVVDAARRLDHLQQHTAQHLLSQAVLRHGEAATVSVHLGRESCNIDLDRALGDEALRAAEATVQQVIYEDREVRVHDVRPDELERFDLRRIGYQGERIRLVEVDDFDVTTCGGTHAHRTGQVGMLCLLGAERTKAGMRVHFLAGGRVARRFREQHEILERVARRFDTDFGQVEDRVHKALEEARESRRERDLWQEEALAARAAGLRDAAILKHGCRRVQHVDEALDPRGLELLARAVVASPATLAALATTAVSPPRLVLARSDDLGTLHCGEWFKAWAEHAPVRGGGRPDLAQGVLTAKGSLPEVQGVRSLLQQAVEQAMAQLPPDGDDS